MWPWLFGSNQASTRGTARLQRASTTEPPTIEPSYHRKNEKKTNAPRTPPTPPTRPLSPAEEPCWPLTATAGRPHRRQRVDCRPGRDIAEDDADADGLHLGPGRGILSAITRATDRGAGGDHDRPRNPAARPRLLSAAYDATVFALVENFVSVFSVSCHLANFNSPSLFDRRADWISRFFAMDNQ